jgi:hypothetical protein
LGATAPSRRGSGFLLVERAADVDVDLDDDDDDVDGTTNEASVRCRLENADECAASDREMATARMREDRMVLINTI